MCGISGFVDFKKETGKSVLEKMNRTMNHRGPDGEGYGIYDDETATIGLGHRRLSIIDLTEGGSQPQSFGSLHITFNGEIYNYAEIKIVLEKLGHIFNSDSDTEVILHAYAEWGSDALQRFIGMFAFVIYDEANNNVFACRDRAGVKPFFYYWFEGLFLFASELKAIMQHPAFSKNINIDALGAYMQFGYVPAPHCIFENTYKLNAGHFLQLNTNNKAITLKQYWNVYDAYNKPLLKIDLPEAIEETEKILTTAFQYRMVSDVPVGVFLSGGYDSSCVTALLQKDNTEKLKTFTIGFADGKLNEAPHAKKVAAHLGTDHTEYHCTQKEVLEIVPDLPFFFDEPFAAPSATSTILLSKIAKEKVSVALSADAGDEIFAGYDRYDTILKYNRILKNIPDFASKGLATIMDLFPFSKLPILKNKKAKYEKVKDLLQNTEDVNLLSSLTKLLSEKENQKLFKDQSGIIKTAYSSKELDPEFYSTLSYLMAIDYQTYLCDHTLQKVDRASMSVGLEGREPFLDHNIIDWAAQLPLKYKYNKQGKKFILKQIVHKYVPKEIMDRPKAGFDVPLDSWLRNDLKSFVEIYFSEDFIVHQNIFHFSEIRIIYNSFYIQNTQCAEKIWYLLMFQMWYDKWINGN